MTTNENILVTGFGPFGVHKINASWESVKLLPDTIEGFAVIKEEIPVSYDYVNERIHQLWSQVNPKLVVHVGVSHLASCITLEACAHQQGYTQLDCFGKNIKTCPASAQECLHSGINVKDICTQLSRGATKACVSSNAGRYLCEYIYYTSLSIDRNRTLFVHVPLLNQPYSAEELAGGLVAIITNALRQLEEEKVDKVAQIVE